VDRYTNNWLAQYDQQRQRRRRLAALKRFQRWLGREPRSLLVEARRGGRGPEKVERVLREYYRYLVDKKRNAKSSAAQWYALLRSFFTVNGVNLGKFPSNIGVQSVYEKPRVPSQDNVKEMVRNCGSARDKFVIAFLAQTGQRIGILTAMKEKMMREKVIRGHGIVKVPATFPNRRGQNVNTLGREYTFIIGRDTMEFLPLLNLDKRSWDKEGRLKVSLRQIGRIVDKAAQAIGIQDKPRTKIGKSWSDVHPNTFRKYWKKCMLDSKADTRAVLHMMGANLPSLLGGLEPPTDKELLEAYEKAESKLSLVDATKTEEA